MSFNGNTLFATTAIDFGDIALNDSVTDKFERPEGGLPIFRIIESCTCFNYLVKGKDDSVIEVDMAITEWPEGVDKKATFDLEKFMTVIYQDETFQTLFLRARVHPKGWKKPETKEDNHGLVNRESVTDTSIPDETGQTGSLDAGASNTGANANQGDAATQQINQAADVNANPAETNQG